MGIYYQTRFYPNMSDTKLYSVLAAMNPIIESSDEERGYIRAEELLRNYRDNVSPTDLTTNSWIVEYSWSTHELNTELKETRRIQVR